jgi:hypothetical protein
MFDRAACPDPGLLAAQPYVSIEALAALSALLDQALKDQTPSAALLSGASEPLTTRIGERSMSRATTNSGKGYRHNRRSRSQHQIDLFGSGLSNDATGAPAWPELPVAARAALTSLMTQLILDHVATTATPRAKEVDCYSACKFGSDSLLVQLFTRRR